MNLNLFIAKKIGGKDAIATTAVAISIIVMVVAIAISEGFKREIRYKAVGFSGEILLTAPGQDITNDRYPISRKLSYLDEIKKMDEVASVEGVAYKPGMLKTDENVQGVLFKGVDSLYSMKFFEKHLIKGRLPDFSGEKGSQEVLISERLAKTLGYEVEDNIIAYFIDSKVKVRTFRITGLYGVQLEEIDKMLMVADLRVIQRLSGWGEDEVSGLEVALKSGSYNKKIVDRVDDIIFEKSGDDESSVVVKEIRDIYPHLFDWLDLLDLNVLVILILMTVVAGFNMISGLLIILFEKISMIGVLKALGMRNSAIGRIFLSRASFIVIKGLLMGNAIALVICLVQDKLKLFKLNPVNYFVDYLPINLDFTTLILLNLVCFVVMMLLMLIPSLFIAGVSPDKTIKMD